MLSTVRAILLVSILGPVAACTPTVSDGAAGASAGGASGSRGGTGGTVAPTPTAGSGGSGGAPSPAPQPPAVPSVDARTPDRPASGPATDATPAPPANRDAGANPDAGTGVDGGAAGKPFPPTGYTCPPGPFGDPLPASRTATLIKANAGSLEGPVWVAEQKALYFCVVAPVLGMGRIDKYDPATNQITTFVSGVDVAGLAVGPQGDIVAAAFDRRNLSRFDPVTGTRTNISNSDVYQGKPFNQMNDLVIRSDGNIYFTDTNYRQDARPGQDRPAYYRLPAVGQATRLGEGNNPNGIALSPDGHFLYVASAEPGEVTRRLTLDDDGAAVGTPTTFFQSGSDGMAMDCAGNLYLTNALSVKVIAPDGKMLGAITGLGDRTVSNAAFGGPDHKTLYVTTQTSLYQIQLNVPGFPN